MKNYFKRNCFFILFVFLMFQSHSTLWAMDGAGMAFKVSLSGKIYHKFSFLLEEDIRPKSNFKQAEWFLTTGEIRFTDLVGEGEHCPEIILGMFGACFISTLESFAKRQDKVANRIFSRSIHIISVP